MFLRLSITFTLLFIFICSTVFGVDCYTEIDPYYLQFDVPSMIHIWDVCDVETVHSNIIDYFWGPSGWPSSKMPVSVTTVTSGWFTVLDQSNISYVEKIDVETDYGLYFYLYMMHPVNSTNHLIFINPGHSNDLTWGGCDDVMNFFLGEGFTVIAYWMPLFGENTSDAYNVPNYGNITLTNHDDMANKLENSDGSFFRFFVEPVVVTINYIEDQYDFKDISITGVSGGGNQAHLCSAVDPRIKISLPVAGSSPLYLHDGPCGITGFDAEQDWPGLYVDRASWLDLYILASYGRNREQLQILNQYDACCFFGIVYQTYEPTVIAAVEGLCHGKFSVFLDSSHMEHKISQHAIYDAMYPTIMGHPWSPPSQDLGPVAGWDTTNSSFLQTTETDYGTGAAPSYYFPGDMCGILEIDNSYNQDDAYIQQTVMYPWTTLGEPRRCDFWLYWMRPVDSQGEMAYVSIWDNDQANSANWVLNSPLDNPSYITEGSPTTPGDWVKCYRSYYLSDNADRFYYKITLSRTTTESTRRWYLDDFVAWRLNYTPFSWLLENPGCEEASDDNVEVIISESSWSADLAEGGNSDAYTVVLGTNPGTNVSVTVDPDDQLTVNGGAQGAATILTFTSANWDTPQTVDVNAFDDSYSEGFHTGTITHTATGGAYEGITINDVVADITDNENYCGEPGQIYLDADIAGPEGVGDCYRDCLVNSYDFAYMASQWLE